MNVVWRQLIEAGAFKLNSDGRFQIDSTRADSDIRSAAAQFITAMAIGDAKSVRVLLSRYGAARPEVSHVLERMGPAPTPGRAIYRTAEQIATGP